MARLARVVKWSKLAYSIKTRRVLFRQESHKASMRKPRCLLKDSLQGGMSMILNPTTGHPNAYEKFVMDKHMKAKNTQKRYLSVDDLVT